MGKTIKKMVKMSRREGVALSTGVKILKVMQKRPYTPGVHGSSATKGGRARLSVYGAQLREKQKAKRIYGMMEKQFRNCFEKATRMHGNSADNLARLLEMRLDNTVFRMGFAKTRPQARQMVSHGMFTVNGKKVNIPSFSVSIDDIIAVKENKRTKKLFEDLEKRMANCTIPGWLHTDVQAMSGKVVSNPEGEDLKEVYDPKLIVEFYSR
jgi:small subunit ribosomal protein S4